MCRMTLKQHLDRNKSVTAGERPKSAGFENEAESEMNMDAASEALHECHAGASGFERSSFIRIRTTTRTAAMVVIS